MRVALAFAALVLAGCSSPAVVEDAPPATLPVAGSERLVPVAGNLTLRQTAAIICPMYIESPSSNEGDQLEVSGAMALDLRFDWTPAVPAFASAILELSAPVGTGPVREVVREQMRGPPGTEWRLETFQLEAFGDQVNLMLVGPDCPDDLTPRTGFVYEQVIAYTGFLTFPA